MRINSKLIIGLLQFHILLLSNPSVSLTQERLSKGLGLQVNTIYIDPSYGGKERGPLLANKQYSSDATLLLAQKLQVLLASAGFSVHLSREGDRFVDLETRTYQAKVKGADVYMRIKVSERKENCIRLFITRLPIGNKSSQNVEEKKLSELKDELSRIMRDLQADDKYEYSLRLAHSLKKNLESGQIVDCIKMQRIFDYILLNTQMPAVTVDFGVSIQPKKSPYILDSEVQNKIVRALADSIIGYSDEHTHTSDYH